MNKLSLFIAALHPVVIRLITAVAMLSTLSPGQAAEVTNLRCENLKDPLGIDVVRPGLSWRIEAQGVRGLMQTTYQVLVASSEKLLKEDKADLWDSKKVISDQSNNIEYKGKPLKSRMKCFWKVKVWDTDGKVSEWSRAGSWTMGILKPEDWKGTWIKSDLELFDYQKELKKLPDHDREGESPMWERAPRIRQMTSGIEEAPAVWLRREFPASGKPFRRATVYISGPGFYELYLNGRRIDDHFLNCAPYDFDKAVPYQVHDVTNLIRAGTNAIGVILGNGYFNPVIPSALREYAADWIDTPRMRFELLLEYEDGTNQNIVSDDTWQFTTSGPIRFNSVRSGETYDARKELGDWASVGYNAEGWKKALIAEAPAGALVNQNLPPVRLIEEIPAVSVVRNGDSYRFDIGVESTGWARMKVRGKPGQKITVSYPGMNSHTLGPYQECHYICKGDNEEIFEPRFAFNGYREVVVSGLDYKPQPGDLVGCRVVSDLARTGHFSCSSPEFNKIQEVVCRTIINYNIMMPMDPVREKVCWTQDVESNFKATACNFDVRAIYAKWQEDYIRSVQADGYVPTVVPGCFDGPTINGPWWGGMIVYNPWQLYNFYGDRRILERSYEPIKHYIRYLDSIAKDNIITWGLGDWLDTTPDCKQNARPQNTTVHFTSTCAYLMYNDILRQTALLLGKKKEALHFATKCEKIRTAINGRFFNPATGVYDKGSQTGYLLALLLEVPTKKDRARVMAKLKEQIISDGLHVTSGFVGLPLLLPFLNENAMGDLAWKLATRREYPGWFDMIFTRRNSVLKEDWAGKMVQMPSLAASIGEWFYRSLGGIRPNAPGFRSFIVQPYTATLEWVKCEYESPYGLIVSNWQKKDGTLYMDVTVPGNTTATVYVPSTDVNIVTESGNPVNKMKGVKFLHMENGTAVFEVGSGIYSFHASLN